MLKLSHRNLILFSGLIWFVIGCSLLTLGLKLISQAITTNTEANRPLLNGLGPYLGGVSEAAALIIIIALGIGYLKATRIFSKTVNSSVARIRTLPNPAPFSRLYTKKYYILLGTMILLGMLVRFLPNDTRGAIDVVIGSALINGAVLYFRAAFASQAVA